MSVNKEIEFNNIVSDILKNDKFITLKYELHHGISRLEHSLHVARTTYRLCKMLHIKDYEDATRAALLHDFYVSDEIVSNDFVNHPEVACQNAIEHFDINVKQQNIIAAHMFPLSKELPKNLDSWIVSGVDKAVALYECAKYKMPLQLGAICIYLINFLSIQR